MNRNLPRLDQHQILFIAWKAELEQSEDRLYHLAAYFIKIVTGNHVTRSVGRVLRSFC